MRKIRDLIRLKFITRLSHEQIARALSISKGVVAKYAARIQRCGIEPRELLQLTDAQVLEHVQPRSKREVYGDRAPVDCARIHTELKRPGVTLTLLWQEYVAANGGRAAYRYSQFALRYHTYVASLRRSMRQVHRAGEKLFIDYAGQSVPYGGEGQRAQIFVAVLGASNYTFACATAHQRLEDWIGALVRALGFIGGVPQLIVPDNARALIADPDRYEPRASLTVQDLAHHYDTAVLPARPRRPQDKAKVEVAVQVVERWILARLRDHRFQTLVEVDGAIGDLLDSLNTRAFRRLPGSRQIAYELLDRSALKPLPPSPYEFALLQGTRQHRLSRNHRRALLQRSARPRASGRRGARNGDRSGSLAPWAACGCTSPLVSSLRAYDGAGAHAGGSSSTSGMVAGAVDPLGRSTWTGLRSGDRTHPDHT